MTNTEIRAIFDSAIALPEGQHIRIPCPSRSEQESTRVQLYKQRSTYKRNLGDNAVQLSISRVTLNTTAAQLAGGRYFVTITPYTAKSKIVVVGEDGKETELSITPAHELESTMTAEQQRAVEFMVADGWHREEATQFVLDEITGENDNENS
jgi:hypothetical protein